jgi:hypothetical protein
MNGDAFICGLFLTAASHQWRQRMKEAHIVWRAVMKVVVSALALFATLMAVFPARRRTPIAQLDRPFAHVISQGFQTLLRHL